MIQRGTGRGINLPVPVAGKTGTDQRRQGRVVHRLYLEHRVAGCYIGHDQPRTHGHRSRAAASAAPVFQSFMSKAVKKYGGSAVRACRRAAISSRSTGFTGARLPDDATGPNVVAEYFREGAGPGLRHRRYGRRRICAWARTCRSLRYGEDEARGRRPSPPPPAAQDRPEEGAISAR
ncbi:MAG: hypothetical protein MZV49_25050 [Rhodopseudomonas palustris]|nr:hypothetical protein [Rhodopseudomonas palustris]